MGVDGGDAPAAQGGGNPRLQVRREGREGAFGRGDEPFLDDVRGELGAGEDLSEGRVHGGSIARFGGLGGGRGEEEHRTGARRTRRARLPF